MEKSCRLYNWQLRSCFSKLFFPNNLNLPNNEVGQILYEVCSSPFDVSRIFWRCPTLIKVEQVPFLKQANKMYRRSSVVVVQFSANFLLLLLWFFISLFFVKSEQWCIFSLFCQVVNLQRWPEFGGKFLLLL